MSNYHKQFVKGFVDFLFDNDEKVASSTFADVCMLYFEIEISQTQGQNRSHCQDIHYLPEIVDPMPG